MLPKVPGSNPQKSKTYFKHIYIPLYFSIFRPAMSYILNVIIAHMRRIALSDYEYLAIIAMFLWSEGEPELPFLFEYNHPKQKGIWQCTSTIAGVQGIKPETMKTIYETQDQIFRDLHVYYQFVFYYSAESLVVISHRSS